MGYPFWGSYSRIIVFGCNQGVPLFWDPYSPCMPSARMECFRCNLKAPTPRRRSLRLLGRKVGPIQVASLPLFGGLFGVRA